MTRATPRLHPGTLWTRLGERNQRALRSGALQPIPTEYELVEQDGIRFIVRVLSTIARKEAVRCKQIEAARAGEEPNPFLPYDEELFVADLSETHLGLLNKFNVIEHHLLIVTRDFEDQESLLNPADFEALWIGLSEIDGLAFYNGGPVAGASQRHKHLQLVPLPLAPTALRVPIEPALAAVRWQGDVGISSNLPFVHAFIRLPDLPAHAPHAAETLLKAYRTLLEAVGMDADGERQSTPYNLLATREWMLLVPRSRERFESISVNALGFTGALLVRDRHQLAIVEKRGPMTVLRGVAVPV